MNAISESYTEIGNHKIGCFSNAIVTAPILGTYIRFVSAEAANFLDPAWPYVERASCTVHCNLLIAGAKSRYSWPWLGTAVRKAATEELGTGALATSSDLRVARNA